ncbi:MAG: ECF transporter S component [Oscillospiraceae bacterium]|nr:ECF transporter S component [Candidatus Limimonas egerieequi]
MRKEKVDKKILRITELGVLLAIIIIMGFTPIGYIKFGVVEITLITVPVIIGAMVVEPAAGALLGFAFGMTSFIQCFGISPFGSAMLEINPFLAFLVTVPTRTLMGWLTGLFYKAINRHDAIGFAVTGLVGSLLNTLFFMTMLLACFWQIDYIQNIVASLGTTNVFAVAVAFVGINGLIEAICCTILATVISKALYKWFES